MGKTGFVTLGALSVLLLFGANLATALEPIPKESGFSGFVRPGAGYINYKSNMVASFTGFKLSDDKTDSLTDSPDSQSRIFRLRISQSSRCPHLGHSNPSGHLIFLRCLVQASSVENSL